VLGRWNGRKHRKIKKEQKRMSIIYFLKTINHRSGGRFCKKKKLHLIGTGTFLEASGEKEQP
jgi:hypothetical protein